MQARVMFFEVNNPKIRTREEELKENSKRIIIELSYTEIDAKIVMELINQGFDPNYCDHFGRSCLHFACWHSETLEPIIKLLVEKGCNPLLRDLSGRSCLDCLSLNQADLNISVMEYFFTKGCKLENEKNILFNVCNKENVNIKEIDYLVLNGVNIHDVKSQYGETLFTSYTKIAAIKRLLFHGIDPKTLNNHCSTLFNGDLDPGLFLLTLINADKNNLKTHKLKIKDENNRRLCSLIESHDNPKEIFSFMEERLAEHFIWTPQKPMLKEDKNKARTFLTCLNIKSKTQSVFKQPKYLNYQMIALMSPSSCLFNICLSESMEASILITNTINETLKHFHQENHNSLLYVRMAN